MRELSGGGALCVMPLKQSEEKRELEEDDSAPADLFRLTGQSCLSWNGPVS